ncbi:acyl-CoA dehydrogenase family protein [Actinomadura algeriensis]|uniref:Alkylation response protein AidB-like acyl-CoA dehydrogenase n=1 Tax=Actinomadura algeriensis TaxID=1679523 RepID=A0ABR9JRI4_9ACTN|nr:acyl-CoA dehydrogenase family protein [Actinomadura algeriensis]MBE1532740.1 alkylation response protein AidB-like acyl-CoA dehydrogenase [Actinomadura algeriensis]
MGDYLIEPVDRLPFGAEEKARRYATERYRGAAGRNWYGCDPTLRFLMRRHLGDGFGWAEPRLRELGALMGGPVARWAEETDRNPPRLEKYDRWGRDVSEVVMPPSFEAARREIVATSFTRPEFVREAKAAGADPVALGVAWSYLLDQADIGMACALGTGGDMVVGLAEAFAPDDVKARVRALFAAGAFSGEAAQLLTERAGGSDLGALESTAARDGDGDAWRLDGFKWFASNANGSAFVVLAKPVGADDGVRGIAPFLVLRERRDGTRNGVRIRRLKDKLGTRSVASAEIEFTGAEAFLLAPAASAGEGGDGRGLARMMELTNGARLGIAAMGLGCARRSLVEALCYARAREAFGAPLADQPLMRRKLAELVVETEAVQALVFDGYLTPLRIGAALVKLRAARLGVTAASDAIEAHGGNGYIEQWPVARILRDAQVNPIWEGGDNVLCLDVRRAIERQGAHEPFLERVAAAAGRAPSGDDATAALVQDRIGHLREAIDAWRGLDKSVAEARLYPLAQYMADVYAAALLLEQAGWEREDTGADRKALVARLYARAHLADRGPLRGIDAPAEELERFDELVGGAFEEE